MLPEIKHPILKLVLPSNGKTISYRPYTVREEKLFLTARMSEDFEEAVDTLLQVLKNCILTEDVKVDDLPMFDIEWLFMNLRKNSVSNVVELFYDDEGTKIPFKIDLADVTVYKDPKHSTKLKLTEGVYASMRYPNLRDILKLEAAVTAPVAEFNDLVFEMFLNNVEAIYDDDKKYDQFTKEELSKLILSLPLNSMEEVRQFFETMPVILLKTTVKTPSGPKEVTLRGLRDFFTF